MDPIMRGLAPRSEASVLAELAEATAAGRAARRAGLPRNSNPHGYGKVNHAPLSRRAWFEGWDAEGA